MDDEEELDIQEEGIRYVGFGRVIDSDSVFATADSESSLLILTSCSGISLFPGGMTTPGLSWVTTEMLGQLSTTEHVTEVDRQILTL